MRIPAAGLELGSSSVTLFCGELRKLGILPSKDPCERMSSHKYLNIHFATTAWTLCVLRAFIPMDWQSLSLSLSAVLMAIATYLEYY